MQRFGSVRILMYVVSSAFTLAFLCCFGALTQPSRRSSSTNLRLSQTPRSVDERDLKSATTALAEADELRARWDEASLLKAIEKYEQAASFWNLTTPDQAARSLKDAGDIYFILSKYKEALQSYRVALKLSKKAQDKTLELDVLNSTAYAYIYLGENQQALELTNQVREDRKHLTPSGTTVSQRLEAQALNNLGEIYYGLGDLRGSLKAFAQALELWTSLNDQRGLALVHLNQGYSYTDMGDLEEAIDHYDRSLVLWRQVGDLRGIALVTTAIGGVHSFRGDKQRALDSHAEALKLFRRIGNQQGESAALNGVAQTYEDVGQYQLALENYKRALDLNRQVHNRDFMALDEYYIGRVHSLMNQDNKGLVSYQSALTVSRQIGDRQIEAHVVRGIGIIESSEGKNRAALKQFVRAMKIYDQIGDQRSKAYTLNAIGHLYAILGEQDQAVGCFQQALPLVREAEDKKGESLTLYNLASIAGERGNLEEALSFIKDSVHIVESSRMKIDSTDLRTSYFAQTHKHYELYIDLLMQIAQRHPETDYVAYGLLVSEQSRARSLLDTLISAGAGLNENSSNQLKLREAKLAEQRDAKIEYRTRLLNSNATIPEAQQIANEIRLLNDELEQLRAEIRKQNPRYAGFTQPESLSVQEIKEQLDPTNDLLLEFSLGDHRSYLWVVSRTSVRSYELPSRTIIEQTANEVYRLLTMRQQIEDDEVVNRPGLIEESDQHFEQQAETLSSILLGQVATQLDSKRLIIVTDGALQRIPFEALPVPSRDPQGSSSNIAASRLLMDDHEIVQVPSASVLAAIRKERLTAPPDKTIFVLADPVFEQDDPRVAQMKMSQGSIPDTVDDGDIRKMLEQSSPGGEGWAAIPRLTGSLSEAKSIMEVTSATEATLATGFEASRVRIMGDEIKHFRILHFATHGLLNSEHPEASGLILAMVDKDGRPQNGYLNLRDVYGLDIESDLVVLSACRTRLGRNVEGEGVMGLSRGFLYAGSRSVVASLWKVDDEATAQLMKTFYASLLRDGLPPSAALRKAKQSLQAQARWRSPYFWAAFVLDGEYTGNLVKQKKGQYLPLYLLLAAVTIIGLLTLWRRRKKFRLA